ncbi:MAG: hypothetical protein SP1CHLAM54_00300 [Chlamydiia bacterium]|nr:hypothetical protein [Chlamydiia bacterium]MCH9614952.1 hypothetical protein [Chlamydiia bacterium]MCH9629998.1 hypothetical protein [Chlamydiia bacterium]
MVFQQIEVLIFFIVLAGLFLMGAAIYQLTRAKRHKGKMHSKITDVIAKEKAHAKDLNIYDLKKKLQRVQKESDKKISTLETQVHALKQQMKTLNAAQMKELKAAQTLVDKATKEKTDLESQIEGLKTQLKALDFRA